MMKSLCLLVIKRTKLIESEQETHHVWPVPTTTIQRLVAVRARRLWRTEGIQALRTTQQKQILTQLDRDHP